MLFEKRLLIRRNNTGLKQLKLNQYGIFKIVSLLLGTAIIMGFIIGILWISKSEESIDNTEMVFNTHKMMEHLRERRTNISDLPEYSKKLLAQRTLNAFNQMNTEQRKIIETLGQICVELSQHNIKEASMKFPYFGISDNVAIIYMQEVIINFFGFLYTKTNQNTPDNSVATLGDILKEFSNGNVNETSASNLWEIMDHVSTNVIVLNISVIHLKTQITLQQISYQIMHGVTPKELNKLVDEVSQIWSKESMQKLFGFGIMLEQISHQHTEKEIRSHFANLNIEYPGDNGAVKGWKDFVKYVIKSANEEDRKKMEMYSAILQKIVAGGMDIGMINILAELYDKLDLLKLSFMDLKFILLETFY